MQTNAVMRERMRKRLSVTSIMFVSSVSNSEAVSLIASRTATLLPCYREMSCHFFHSLLNEKVDHRAALTTNF